MGRNRRKANEFETVTTLIPYAAREVYAGIQSTFAIMDNDSM